MIQITLNAAQEILKRQQEEGCPDKGLRLFVEESCCQDRQFGMAFDTHAPGDQRFKNEGTQDLEVLVDAHSLPYFKGITIGFNDRLTPHAAEDTFELFNPTPEENACACREGRGSEAGCSESSCCN